MRVYSQLYKTNANLKTFMQSNELGGDKKQLIIVHSDVLLKEEAEQLVAFISELAPKSEIIGCSVGGIIFKGMSLKDETLISFVDCSEAEIVATSVQLKSRGDYRSPKLIASELYNDLGGIDNSFLFAFYPPSFPRPSQVVEQLNAKSKSFNLIGGGAFSVKEDLHTVPAYVIHNNAVSEDFIVVAKIKGDSLIKTQVAATGIQSIGRAYKVTKSEGQHIIEIENQPARKWLNYLIGEEFLKPGSYVIDGFPIVRKGEEGRGLNVNFHVDLFTKKPLGNELFVFDEIREGEEITAGYIDPNSAVKDAGKFCKIIDEAPSEALFAYSCLTRRFVLHNCAKWELQPFTSTQITGAFMAGELIYDGKACKYSNSAFTVASLSEDKRATVNLDLSALGDSGEIQFDNLSLVNYLLSTANSELKHEINESKQKLARQLVIDSDSGLPNLTKFVYDNETENFNSLCLLSLKNESIIRVFLDKKKYLYYVGAMADGVNQTLNDNYKLYRYAELSVIIARNCSDKDEFIADMQRLKTHLNRQKHKDYAPVYEMSIAFGEENLLNKVELAYVNLHKGNGEFLVYSEEDKDSNFNKEIRILQVINEAISYKRVIPFYQGIHNNFTGNIEICEALMRIADATGKIYYPNEFLPVAKEYKLYDRLSKMMIETVFMEANRHSFSVSINLNIRDIYNYDILNVIFTNLEKAERPERFIFEIVEGEEITDYDYLREFTNKIHKLGGLIAIDDFGSGYSNLMHVLRIDVDYLKITGEIIKEICRDDSCQEFVSMISGWANSRNKKVVAEFVENKDIQKMLMEYNVAYSQGYLFSKPSKLN